MIDIPNLRVGGLSTFFDNDLTYLHILQDVCILLSFIALTWDLLESLPPSSGDRIIGERLHGISLKTLVLYALTFTARLAEYFPFEHLCYDLASCSGFAFIFWIATFSWIYFDSVQQANALMEQSRSSQRSGIQTIENMDTGRPVVLHAAVGITAILAYVFNYSHLTLTPRLFLWSWSHYLDAVAMLPQLWTLTKTFGDPYAVSRTVWIGVGLMALSKIFMLLNWVYLLYVAEMLDVLAVASGLFHLIVFGIFMIT